MEFAEKDLADLGHYILPRLSAFSDTGDFIRVGEDTIELMLNESELAQQLMED